MTTNSPNPVDGDVQALIADCHSEMTELEKALTTWGDAWIPYLQSKLMRQKIALAALTAEPADRIVDDGCSQRIGCVPVSDTLNCTWPLGTQFYTTPPAQLLRPVELPDIKTARSDWSAWNWIEHLGGRFQNGQPGDYIEFGSVYAVAQMLKQYRRTVTAEVIAEIAESLRKQGYEVKND